MSPNLVTDLRCPVLLLTGRLGSGKTTLLRHWLKEEALEHCAIIINEIGEVEFDASRIGPDIIAAGLISQQCVCCSGLPDLLETLERMYWDRLHRNMSHFDRVVIETSGVANPQPIIEMLSSYPFLKEKYRLEAVISTCACITPLPEWTDELALSQISHANCLVLTKQDLSNPVQVNKLRGYLQELSPAAIISTSDLTVFPELVPLLHAVHSSSPSKAIKQIHCADTVSKWADKAIRQRTSGPQVHSWFESQEHPIELYTMQQKVASWVSNAKTLGVLRFKGYWRCKGAFQSVQAWEAQWTLGDGFVQLAPVVLRDDFDKWGVTFIAKPYSSTSKNVTP